MNTLLEPRFVPQLPEVMLMDDDDASNDNCRWLTGLADFGSCSSRAAPPAPASLPIAIASSGRHFAAAAGANGGVELVDSLESTQTLLGASLQEAAAAPAQLPYSMRFVPVPVAQQPQPYVVHPGQHYSHHQMNVMEQPMYGGSFEPAAAYQHHPAQQYSMQYQHEAPTYSSIPHSFPPTGNLAAAAAGWELPAGHGGDMKQYGFSGVQYNQDLLLPIPAAAPFTGQMRRAASEDVLRSGHFGGSYAPASLAPVVEVDGFGSEGSDSDTLGEHRPHHGHHTGYLPQSQSAPAFGAISLERSNSSRRSLTHFSGASSRGGGTSGSAASPRTICLKLKAPRPRPSLAAAARAAATIAANAGPAAAGDGSPRPARLSARRSMALSAAAMAAEDDFTSDSDVEPVVSAAVSEEPFSGGGSTGSGSGSGAAVAQSASGKKKHNPWSLTETEALVEGVRLLGPSKWAEIKKLAVGGIADVLANRSAVDLKDKWRNLTRVAKLPKSVLKARAHKSTSDIPLDLLLTVKELMEMSRD